MCSTNCRSRTPQRPSTGPRHLRLSMPILSSRGVAHCQADRRLELQKLGPPRGSVEQGRGHVKSMQWRVGLGMEGFHESSSLPACRNRAGECQATSILCPLVWAALLLPCHAPNGGYGDASEVLNVHSPLGCGGKG